MPNKPSSLLRLDSRRQKWPKIVHDMNKFTYYNHTHTIIGISVG